LTARLLDGRALAAETERALAAEVARITPRVGIAPGLAAVLVGSFAPSVTYVRRKAEACGRVGFRSEVFALAEESTQRTVEELIAELSARPDIHGVLLQEPLTAGLDARAALARLDPRKDVDGLTAVSQAALLAGTPGLRPATARGVMALIAEAGLDPAGREAVVVGRSLLVGRPTALLLLAAHATVTVCHSRTPELGGVTARGEILVAAAGRPGLITGAMVRPGAVVIDVGITRRNGRLVGDVERPSVEPVAAALTPVPGGVGPMTIAMLLDNTWQAFRAQVTGEETR